MLSALLRSVSQGIPRARQQVARETLLPSCWGLRACATAASSTCQSIAAPTYMIWGANTDVGKTLVSAGLAAAASRNKVGW